MKEHKRRTITAGQAKGYLAWEYSVETVIPVVDRPQLVEYTMTREELEEFFDPSRDFAEFVVKVMPIIQVAVRNQPTEFKNPADKKRRTWTKPPGSQGYKP